ncbi:hypothetical protein S7711_09026 [Stachybotrys chartarum IBT 7711]|uniref:ASST-domain-containing protein n=1 Tax=Stachybotrys chartarum (strain CBS 109288 / IBT 7711) TaxID=1280523 RepID=A0A084B2N9_STACB|nr:hypothetical protein S7711_09026 [Stachybotrys chartarum IBT 7711]
MRPSLRISLGLQLFATALFNNGISPAVVNASPLSARRADTSAASWYDWGYYGAFPRRSYESFGAESPRPALVATDPRCDDGYTFVEPRGHYVYTPGPVMLDNAGELVWMNTEWGQAMDVKVQRYRDEDYITFWHGTDSGTFGTGSYIMLDESYQVFKNVTPVGNYAGDLHEFRITDSGTALMTIYHPMATDMSALGIDEGWIYDSIFQEVDLETGKLIFEWHASDHFPVGDSLAPVGTEGRTLDTAWDYFHINSIDKDSEGNYLISSRYMCNVAAISAEDGHVIWQLGGAKNSFKDLSDGAATNFTWNHHAAWVNSTTLTLFDNGSNGKQHTAEFSRGLMITYDTTAMTATLAQDYISPYKVLAISQGSVQILPNGNVFVGWGHVPAYTEFTPDGHVLCETHIGPINYDVFGWVKNYRTFKYRWVGRPQTLPSLAVRPNQNAVYVSWNGATEVAKWMLQSSPHVAGDSAQDHDTVDKTGFETKITIPSTANGFIRVVALDKDNQVLARSAVVPRNEYTVVEPMAAPSRGGWIEPFHAFMIAFGSVVGIIIAVCFRYHLRRGFYWVVRRSNRVQYSLLPSK